MRALALQFGLEGIELRALGGQLDLPAYFTAAYGTPDELARKETGQDLLPIVAMGSSLRLVGATPESRAEFVSYVPWAEALGVRYLRAFDGVRKEDGGWSDDEGAATLRWWRELKAQHEWRIDLMVETHDSLLTAESICRFAAASPGVAILWDAHHTWKKGVEDPAKTFSRIRSHVVHIHVKDSLPAPDRPGGFEYVLPGAGTFPMAALKVRLRAEFSGFVSLEWEKYWVPALPPLQEALQAAASINWF